MILKLNISVYGHGMGPEDMTVSKGHISWEVCVVGEGGGLRVWQWPTKGSIEQEVFAWKGGGAVWGSSDLASSWWASSWGWFWARSLCRGFRSSLPPPTCRCWWSPRQRLYSNQNNSQVKVNHCPHWTKGIKHISTKNIFLSEQNQTMNDGLIKSYINCPSGWNKKTDIVDSVLFTLIKALLWSVFYILFIWSMFYFFYSW